MSRSGRKNFAPLSENSGIDALLHGIVTKVRCFAEEQIGHIEELVRIGIALTAEKDLDRLLEMIMAEAMRFTNAEGDPVHKR